MEEEWDEQMVKGEMGVPGRKREGEKIEQPIYFPFSHLLSEPASSSIPELPIHSKFLLIAAYLASYNPAKTDQRFFAKVCGMSM